MLTFLPSVMTARLVLVAATIIANTCSAAFITSNQTTFFNGHDIFIPSGANYIRLNGSQGNEQQYPVYHSTFSPLFYNQTQSSLALSVLHDHLIVDFGAYTACTGNGCSFFQYR
eukprot:m.46952 g.46952  ORF g.46952 m.46952 type:complete len:114 (+) comp13185_c1_seq3:60-401(+)